MYNKYIILLLIVLSLLYCNIKKYPQRSKLIITILIEGISTDGFQFAKTPNIDKLIKKGAISLKMRGTLPINPYTNWATIISGTYPTQHGIIFNDTTQLITPQIQKDNGFYPSLFYSIKQTNPGLKTAFIYNREKLINLFNISTVDYKSYTDSLPQAINLIKKLIYTKKINYILMHTKLLNDIGNKYGWISPQYIERLEFIDNQIGELYNFIKTKGLLRTTNIIIMSDHGEKIKKSSCYINNAINTLFIISGDNIVQNKILPEPINTIDYAPTILYMFNYQTPEYMYGKPIHQAFKINKHNYKYGNNKYIPKPAISHKSGLYIKPISVALYTYIKGAKIYYTLDGSSPSTNSKLYKYPIKLTESTTLKAICINKNSKSQTTTLNYQRIKGIKKITLRYKPDTNFINTNPLSLFDKQKATFDYKNTRWLTFCKQDLHIKIDFTTRKKVKHIHLRFLQDTIHSIYLPINIEVYGSYDGRRYKKNLKYIIPQNTDYKKNQIYDIPLKINSKFEYKSIIIKANNRGFLPIRHKNAGEKVWLFIDEIQID